MKINLHVTRALLPLLDGGGDGGEVRRSHRGDEHPLDSHAIVKGADCVYVLPKKGVCVCVCVYVCVYVCVCVSVCVGVRARAYIHTYNPPPPKQTPKQTHTLSRVLIVSCVLPLKEQNLVPRRERRSSASDAESRSATRAVREPNQRRSTSPNAVRGRYTHARTHTHRY
jgi:hypothetical protein